MLDNGCWLAINWLGVVDIIPNTFGAGVIGGLRADMHFAPIGSDWGFGRRLSFYVFVSTFLLCSKLLRTTSYIQIDSQALFSGTRILEPW